MSKVGVIILFLLLVFSQEVYAEKLTGKDIMEMAFNRDDGSDGYFKIEMVLEDKKGNKRERLLEIYTKDYGDLIKTFLEFTEPVDIEGTSFLTLENEGKDDTQYLYLPALGRAKRIVSSQKSLRFVNTDFTYEDMQRRQPDKDEHKLLGEENCRGYTCHVIESVPKNKSNSQYSKRISWVGKESLVILRIDFYDKKGKKTKEFKVERLEKREGIWTTMQTVMIDLGDEHKTFMKTLEVEYNQGLADDIFTLRRLEED